MRHMSGRKVLNRSFFSRSALSVARGLLGKVLVRKYRGKRIEGMITEVEAYTGAHDLACHGAKGRTARTEVMFGPAGYWYVYFVYGMHWMLNIVTGKEGSPSAVLIRAAFVPKDFGEPKGVLSLSTLSVDRVDGPGKLTRYLRIGKSLNGKIAIPKSGLWIEDRGIKIPSSAVERTPRIGVGYAGEWAEKPYRLFLKKDLTSRTIML